MNIEILNASMSHTEEEGYVGKVAFAVTGHTAPYEISFQRKKGKEWGYGLFFLNEPGKEEEIMWLEDKLEEEDEWFEQLLAAAKEKLEQA